MNCRKICSILLLTVIEGSCVEKAYEFECTLACKKIVELQNNQNPNPPVEEVLSNLEKDYSTKLMTIEKQRNEQLKFGHDQNKNQYINSKHDELKNALDKKYQTVKSDWITLNQNLNAEYENKIKKAIDDCEATCLMMELTRDKTDCYRNITAIEQIKSCL
jgi:hypothetical protein